MRKIILAILIVILISSVSFAQTLTPDDKTYIKKVRLIRQLEKQIDIKQEEMRIAVSALKTTFKADIQAINLQIQQAELDLEALIP